MNMVERVARAICALNYQDPEELTNAYPDGPMFPVWKEFEASSRAAIEAMREPTEAMLYVAIRTEVEASCSVYLDSASVLKDGARQLLSAMIDAALTETE